MKYISFKILKNCDSEAISQLLLKSPESYTKYFHPFKFQDFYVKVVLETAVKDIFFGIELTSTSNEVELVGFYMLRGLDEGYPNPMYGVFISHQYSGNGIASLTISHAESFCKLCGYKQLLLKVNMENIIAKKIYESLGFKFFRAEPSINNIVLYKNMLKAGEA